MMKISTFLLISIFSLVTLVVNFADSATVVVDDGGSEWENPTVQVGDSVIFRDKDYSSLYIFRNRRAFNLCNFTQATVLTKPNATSFIWHPSRLGNFYFSFYNGSSKACQSGQKLAIKVSSSLPPQEAATSPQLPPVVNVAPPPATVAPPPTLGGDIVSSSPAYPWPFHPHESVASPTPSPDSAIIPTDGPSVDGGSSIPFINSNPAVPIPTGEVDSATIQPVTTSSSGQRAKVVRILAVQLASCCVFLLMLI